MNDPVKANVSLLHVAGGEGRNSPPPGTLALLPPRKAARGRSHDFLFVSLNLMENAAEGRASRLAQVAAQTFFGTPGSVTAALRQATMAVNQALVDSGLEAGLVVGALRSQNLYFSECGTGEAILVRQGFVSRMNGSNRPLGSSLAPMIQFQHIEVQPSDVIILTAAEDVPWSDLSLTGLSGLSIDQLSEHLIAGTDRDITGLIIQVPGTSKVPTSLGATPEIKLSQVSSAGSEGSPADLDLQDSLTPPRAAAGSPSQVSAPADREKASAISQEATPQDTADFASDQPKIWFRQLTFRLRVVTRRLSRLLTEVFVRLIPGTLDAQQFDEFSPNLLAFTAAAVPILVVGISSLIYFKHGRVEQFESYLAQAQSAAIAAQLQSPGEASRPDWVMASQWLDLAESYQTTEESSALRGEVQAALDDLDLVFRLNFIPAVSGGFGPKAELTFVAATATDLYVYDEGSEAVWHAWATGRGFEIDSQFECLDGAGSIPDFGEPVGMVIQPEPGALGTEGVVLIDARGALLYCAPSATPLTGNLAAPDVGWGKIQTVEVFGNNLYVLDPEKNSVWIYDAADGLFSGSPALYFVEEVRELGTAIDLALAQDELIILYAEGKIDRCRREIIQAGDRNLRIRVECVSEPQFQDERAGFGPQATILDAVPVSFAYSPPPEPSLFFLDGAEGTVFHYSMRLVYQGQYPTNFDARASAITGAPPNDLFVAAGEQVYYAQLGR